MFAEAHALIDDVREALPDHIALKHVRYHLERGRADRSSGEKENARREFEMALSDCDQAQDDFHTVDTLHMLAIVSEPEEAQDWNYSAIQKAEASASEKASNWLGSLYNNLGWAYFDKGDFEKALEIFSKGLIWQQSNNREAETRIAKWTIGRAYRAMGRVEEAFVMQQVLLMESTTEDGYISEEIGECPLTLGRKDESKTYFAHAYEMLKGDIWLQSQQTDSLNRLAEMSS